MRRILLSLTALAALTTSVVAEGVTVKSKAAVLKFSGKHYLGFVHTDDSNQFETRRNYLQVKAYFAEDPKSFFRITLDTHQVDDDKEVVGGDIYGTWNTRLKYAYLYLDNVLPFTGVEIGQAHRPWIDYEEHGGWNYRSISKVFVEAGNGAHLTNSADIGVNFKTKTENFSSELGIFNGEGYHGEEDGEGLSTEWRLTYHALGGGTQKSKAKHTYANISFLGQLNAESNKHKNEDLNWMGLHAVYNQPAFLLSAQYITTNDAHDKYAGEGYSANGEYRFMPKWNLIGRYDYFEMDSDGTEKTRMIAGVTHKYNKNIEFIANVLTEEVGNEDETALMLTAEINW
ncbi:MAG: hypothetical protein K0U47_12305 [Epsilonproteobacteria bacterium]|nr:hypothetical protein [Campylobacterota bacterium]